MKPTGVIKKLFYSYDDAEKYLDKYIQSKQSRGSKDADFGL